MSPRHLPPDKSDPLTPDEREWAARLARIGSHDGPPAALDRKILAAAHAAVARRPQNRSWRKRWPTLIGAAASLVIVVGLAWELRPLLRSIPSLSEGPMVAAAPIPRSEGLLSAEVLAAANPVARSAVDSPPPPPAPSVATTPYKPNIPPAIVVPVPEPAPAQPQPPVEFSDDAIPPYADYAGTAAARQAAMQAATNDAATRKSTDERRERATAAAPQPLPAAHADTEHRAAMPAPLPPISAAPTAAPNASATRRDFAPTRGASAASAAQVSTSLPLSAAAEQDNTALDRIEVSGSRISVSELPVRDDASLEPAAWLQRIRDRRDADNLDGARESLALLRQRHPRIRLPDDLARLGR